MLDASSAIMIRTGMLMTTAMMVAQTGSAPGNAESAQSTPMARVAPTGAEKTALKIVASSADASRTRPVLRRTKSRLSPDSGVTDTANLLTLLRPLRTVGGLTSARRRGDSRTQSNIVRQH